MKQFEQSDLLKRLPKQFFAALVNKVGKFVAQGHDVINLGQGNPDQPTPAHIVKALQQASEYPVYQRYSPFRGQLFLKEAVAAFYQREYGVELDPEKEVAILLGGKIGLVEIPRCLLNPGDTVLVPDPGYPDYWSGVELARLRMEMMPLRAEHHFLPVYEELDKEIVDRAKLMFLNYPNNPTGAVATESFFEQTVQFAQDAGLCVVHDFAYGAVGFDGQKPRSFLQTPGAKEVGIEIYTMSKTYNMAGWRVAFAVGNESVIEAINLLQDHTHCSVFGAIQHAAAAALLGSQQCVEDLVARYQSRREVLIHGLREIGWDVKAPAGSFFAWLRVPDDYSSETFSDVLIEQAHVVVAPGIGFGEYGEGYVRVGLLADEERLREAVERIRKLQLF